MGQMIIITDNDKVDAYLAKPEGKPKGALIVIHEVWGLVEHTKDVADRLAAEGYVALAPSLLTDLDFEGKDVAQFQQDLFNPKTQNKAQPELRRLMTPLHNPEFGTKTLKRLKTCFNYLYEDGDNHQKVGVIGFCFGGTYSYTLAVNEPRLRVTIPFYGHSDHQVSELAKISCPVRLFLGANDTALVEGLPALEAKMSEAEVDFKATIYKESGHAFFNNTNPYAFNKQAAVASWASVLKILSEAYRS
jgi:carboxymethylenebutenolidase